MKALEKIQKELMEEIVMPIQRIAEYLSEQIKTDAELETAIESKEKKTLSNCRKYIINKARESAKGSSGIWVDDSTVFGWAREYYIKEETPKAETKKEETPPPKTEKKKTKKETPKAEDPTKEVTADEDDENWLD